MKEPTTTGGYLEKAVEQIREQLDDIETTLKSQDERIVRIDERCAGLERGMERGDNNNADVRALRNDISDLERQVK